MFISISHLILRQMSNVLMNDACTWSELTRSGEGERIEKGTYPPFHATEASEAALALVSQNSLIYAPLTTWRKLRVSSC